MRQLLSTCSVSSPLSSPPSPSPQITRMAIISFLKWQTGMHHDAIVWVIHWSCFPCVCMHGVVWLHEVSLLVYLDFVATWLYFHYSFHCVSLAWVNWYWCSLVLWPEGGTTVYVTPPKKKEVIKGGLYERRLFMVNADRSYYRYLRCAWFITPELQVLIWEVQKCTVRLW